MNQESIAHAACALRLDSASNVVQLLPAGEFRSKDGRPVYTPSWHLDGSAAVALIAASRSAGRMVIDYEHQSLNTQNNGQPAPAAGWFKTLEWREGKGLYATDVEWTERARTMIRAGEYLYISPVFVYDNQTGTITRIVNAALTNTPALDGMDEVAALNQLGVPPGGPFAVLRQAIGSDAAALAALESAEASLTRAFAVIQQRDEARTELRRRNDALQAQLIRLELDEVIEAALSTARLLPAHVEAATRLGMLDLEALRQILDRPPVFPALTGGTQTGGKAPSSDSVSALTSEDLYVCEVTGRDPRQFAELKERTFTPATRR